jgi:hypothetical protein
MRNSLVRGTATLDQDLVGSRQGDAFRSVRHWEWNVRRVYLEGLIMMRRSDFREALAQAVRSQLPTVAFDEERLFKDFAARASSATGSWIFVPDNFVRQ